MVVEMENSRRPFDRSRDPGPMKKPRIAEEPIRPSNPNPRQFPTQRPLGAAVSVPPVSRFRAGGRDAENSSGDPSREAYQPQPVNPHHELVSQYRSALAELIFNSKPIITNLTIIAGENLHAAKAIVATISNNILESILIACVSLRDDDIVSMCLVLCTLTKGPVPSDQKLPSLYLLDSIVKNIGRDYIKYFAARLPEIFIKAYRQVDPPTQSSMQHLFGTWKGVFHPQTLQIIEKELGFNSRRESSPSVVATTRTDPSSQRPPHSIHVNPKYLERQRLQQSGRAKGIVTDAPGIISNLSGDSDRMDRVPSLAAGGSWVEPSVRVNSNRRPPRELLGEPPSEKNIASITGEYDYASDLPHRSRLGAMSSVPDVRSSQRDGLNTKGRISNYSTARLSKSDASGPGRNSIGVSNSWKNSEEEEFMWDVHSRLSETDVTNINPRNDPWISDDFERLESENHLLRPTRLPDAGSRFELENSTDSYSSEQKDQNEYGHWISSPRSLQDGHIQRSSEGFNSVVGASSTVTRKGIQPQAVSSRVRAPGSGILPLSGSRSDRQSALHDSASQQTSTKQDFRRTNFLPQRDPRASRFPAKLQSITGDDPTRSLSSGSQFRNTLVPELHDASLGTNLEPRPTIENPPADSLPGSSEASGQLNMSNLLAAVMKSGILSNNSTSRASKEESFQDEVKPRLQPLSAASSPRSAATSLPNPVAKKKLLTRLKVGKSRPSPGSGPIDLAASMETQTPDENSKASDPISSLLSSLVSKGLISALKTEPPPLLQSQVAPTTRDHSPDHSTNSSISVTASPSDIKPEASVNKGPSAAPKAKGPAAPSGKTRSEPEDLIGLQFRSDKIREFHPSVISSLFDDLPHQCNSCGIRLEHKEQLERHSEMHDEQSVNKRLWVWFPKADDWLAGKPGQLGPDLTNVQMEPEAIEEDGPCVPADENQCACILCGEMFEDHFNQEMDRWMFKGAVYFTIPSANIDAKGPIVHANCLTQKSMHELGIVSAIEEENYV